MDEELTRLFTRLELNARWLGSAHERYNGTEIRVVRDSRGRLRWHINNRHVSRFDAFAFFA
ncbi:hypothetical protein [Burkholderia gladioli]|uniref:hypothetical protein n=1 Tax=Burkholderia gladioli TaxID=28095 RepID=UPI0016414C41|nr:hypothetical protein [Burkholderia gladioli]